MAQPCPTDRGAVEKSAARKSLRGLEDERAFSLRQHVHIVGAQHVRLRHVIAENPAFVRLDAEIAV
jgi:hypothetical protein